MDYLFILFTKKKNEEDMLSLVVRDHKQTSEIFAVHFY